MWEFLGGLAPAGIWQMIGAVVTAGAASWFGYKLGHKTAHRSEYRQILRELLEALSELRDLELSPPDRSSRSHEELIDLHLGLFRKIENLGEQLPDPLLRMRIENIPALLSTNYEQLRATPNGSLLEGNEVEFRLMVIHDAYRAVGKVLRGESVPAPTRLTLVGFAQRKNLQFSAEDIALMKRGVPL
ncbi:hypothetical protein [Glycomyces sp. NPDC048151]|uniref:hypothetical protein n=1 Tax=Glycomyces sp. NPDC048151 TaxID=3364002 RepID=UPI003716695E